jgi:hypothetical protein
MYLLVFHKKIPWLNNILIMINQLGTKFRTGIQSFMEIQKNDSKKREYFTIESESTLEGMNQPS